jgi:flagellum-specific peptidoglycan hydrolase FlgJ
MDPENIKKLLNAFNADPIKLQPKLTPTRAAVDNTYVRPVYIPNGVHKKASNELSGVDTTEVVSEDDITEETQNGVEETPLPDKYSGLQDFYSAMTASDIKSQEAKNALLAQMGIESGWGKKSAGSKYYNYGNITTGSTWKGDWFRGNDTDAKGNAIKQKFRKYSSAQDFFDDYMKLIETLYPQAHEQLLSENFDIDKFSYGLRHGRVGMYAESPTYEESLRKVYNSVTSSMKKQPKHTPQRNSGGILYNY